jgi:hypothetical protein
MAGATMTADTASEAAAPAAPTKPGRPKMRRRNKILLVLLSLVLMGVFRTGFLFIIISMMPSIVTYYMDMSRRRYTYKTIFACNLSGLMPFIGKMISEGPTSSTMQEVMGNAHNWFIIYGAALIGLMMVRIAPAIAYAMISGFHSTQVARLTQNQKRIENEWGPEVTQFSMKEDGEEEY